MTIWNIIFWWAAISFGIAILWCVLMWDAEEPLQDLTDPEEEE
jgi:hypothetical protein